MSDVDSNFLVCAETLTSSKVSFLLTLLISQHDTAHSAFHEGRFFHLVAVLCRW